MKKGDSIYKFLQKCLETLRKDFNELRLVGTYDAIITDVFISELPVLTILCT